MLLFPESGPKKNFRVNGFTKTVTPHLRSICPNVPTAHGLLRSFEARLHPECIEHTIREMNLEKLVTVEWPGGFAAFLSKHPAHLLCFGLFLDRVVCSVAAATRSRIFMRTFHSLAHSPLPPRSLSLPGSVFLEYLSHFSFIPSRLTNAISSAYERHLRKPQDES
jgi:hypothetical protein